MKQAILLLFILTTNLFLTAQASEAPEDDEFIILKQPTPAEPEVLEEAPPEGKFSDNFYLYFSVLQDYKLKNSILSKGGANSTANSSNASDPNTIGLGFHWKDNINIEIELTNDIRITSALNAQPASVKLDLIHVGPSTTYQATQAISLHGKFGLSYIKQQTQFLQDDEVVANTQKEIELFLEGGAEFAFTSEVRMRLGYQYTDYSDIRKVYLNFLWDF